MPDEDMELALLRCAWRLDALDKWRAEVERRLDVCEANLDKVTRAQEIAKAVSAELSNPDPRLPKPAVSLSASLNWPQKIGGMAAGALVLADALKGLIH